MRLLDLYCGAGGAAVGYHRAGYQITGVDIDPQPDYPYEFVKADATDLDPDWVATFDAIHASPPCQRWTTNTSDPLRWPDLIPATRTLLIGTGRPYVIENVVNAPLFRPIQICGSAFRLRVRRHRRFESNLRLLGTPCQHRRQGTVLGVYGKHAEVDGKVWRRPEHQSKAGQSRGVRAGSVEEGAAALGITHITTWGGLTDAIPPAYTTYLGRQILRLTKETA